MRNKRTTQHIDDTIDIGMTGNLSAQPRCQCQVCKAAHDLNQNVGEHSTCSHSRFLVRSIHTTKTAAVAGSNTKEGSEVCKTERSAYHTCIEYQCHQGLQPLYGHPLEAPTHCQERMQPAQSYLDWRADVRAGCERHFECCTCPDAIAMLVTAHPQFPSRCTIRKTPYRHIACTVHGPHTW